MKIIFVNDKKIYNVRYRANLINLLSQFHQIQMLGLFDSPLSLITTVFRVIFCRTCIVVSSNLKSNLLTLCIPWKPKVIILNGLGRYRDSRILRHVLAILIQSQFAKTAIFIQSYADYRFFKKFSKGVVGIKWMKGSGGYLREVGRRENSFSIISRDDKLPRQVGSIQDFFSCYLYSEPIYFIGIKNLQNIDLGDLKYFDTGYVDQKKILSYSQCIFFPDGYGEGIPHTLVDAIVSGANVFMSKKNYIRFGFYKLTKFKMIKGSTHWGKLIVNYDLMVLVASEKVAQDFYDEIKIALLANT